MQHPFTHNCVLMRLHCGTVLMPIAYKPEIRHLMKPFMDLWPT